MGHPVCIHTELMGHPVCIHTEFSNKYILLLTNWSDNTMVNSVDLCSKIRSRKIFFGWTFTEFQTVCKKKPKSDFKSQFQSQDLSKSFRFFFCIIISRLSWIKYLKDVPSILISENENSNQRMDCKDKIPYKKCKKYKQRGKCEEKKIRKKCMLTCEICTPGTTDNFQLESDSKWIRQKFYQFFINKKFKKILYFLICILPNYAPHEITKEFWKNSQFENMMTDFLLRCQNSLRWEICLICHWNIDSWKQKLSFGCVR